MTTPRYSLGRVPVIEHDPRSLAYAHGVLPRSAITAKRWLRRAPVFDQGQVGSCTGNAAAGLVGTDNAVRSGLTVVTVTPEQAARTQGVFPAATLPVDEAFAVLCYELNTRLDTYSGTYQPDDTGSDGLAGAKTLQTLGLADSYLHAFTLDALDSALQNGAVMVGTTWLQSMFTPDASHYLVVDQGSSVAGGHEYVIDELLANGDYGMQNSWGTGWGVKGRAAVHRADMGWLLAQSGDVTVPHLIGAAPVPVPPSPSGPVTKTFPGGTDALDGWAGKPHVWHLATVAANEWKAAQ
jgi:hypothetical protein